MMCHRCPCRILAYRALLILFPFGAPATLDLKLQGSFFAEILPLTAGFFCYRRLSGSLLYGISHRFQRDRSKVAEEEEVVRTVGSFGERRVHSGRVRNSSSSRHNYLDRSRTVSFRGDNEKESKLSCSLFLCRSGGIFPKGRLLGIILEGGTLDSKRKASATYIALAFRRSAGISPKESLYDYSRKGEPRTP
jgi:hypothetical protein